MEENSRKYVYAIFAAVLVVIVIFLVLGTGTSDDFNAGTINPSLWNPEVRGAGPSVTETNQQLEIFLPSTSLDPSAGVVSVFKIRGDFDVQVDFNLIDWPPANGVRSAISVRFDPRNPISYANERTSYSYNDDFAGREVYLTDFSTPAGTIASDDSSGKLRIVRKGSHWSTYYFSDGKWKLDYETLNGDTRDAYIYLGAWSSNSVFIHKNVKLAFDNFMVNSGQVIWP
jgi:hypothetical protein